MAQTRHRRLRNWVITMMVCLTFTVPTAYLLVPHLHRWQRIHQLGATDEAVRLRALQFVIRHAPHDPQVREAAVSQLRDLADDEAALQLYGALRAAHLVGEPDVIDATYQRLAQADERTLRRFIIELDADGSWLHPPAPLEVWLRGITLMLAEPDPRSRLFAAHRIADLHEQADDDRLPTLLQQAVTDDEVSVRYAAVLAAAELAGTPAGQKHRMAYEAVLGTGTADHESDIARDAWLLLALLDPWSGFQANWREAEPTVAEAVLFAALRTNPARAQPALEALHDPDVPPRVRAAAAYAMHMAESSSMTPTAADTSGDPVENLLAWRLSLSVEASDEELARTLAAIGETWDDLPLTTIARLHGNAGRLPQLEVLLGPDSPVPALVQLAILEGLPVDHLRVPIHAQMPDMLRLAAVAVTRDPQVEDLLPLLTRPEPELRDLACIVAIQRFTDAQLEALIEQLLLDYFDEPRMAGAMLAGMSGLKIERLQQRAELENVWLVRQVMDAALWMQQAQLNGQDRSPINLLARDDVPDSTILIALLHREPTDAMEYLFNPRGNPAIDLLDLLDHHRWHRVLAHYLPQQAPPLWHWADPQLKAFQLEVLSNYALIRRGAAWQPVDQR